MESMVTTVWFPAFFKISSFEFLRRIKGTQVWNDKLSLHAFHSSVELKRRYFKECWEPKMMRELSELERIEVSLSHIVSLCI